MSVNHVCGGDKQNSLKGCFPKTAGVKEEDDHRPL